SLPGGVGRHLLRRARVKEEAELWAGQLSCKGNSSTEEQDMKHSAPRRLTRMFFCVMAFAIVATVALAEDKADLDAVAKIKEEGLNRSQVMTTLSYLTDVHGPRLTGSPGIRRAQEWTQQQL